jgi:hypothetical protein
VPYGFIGFFRRVVIENPGPWCDMTYTDSGFYCAVISRKLCYCNCLMGEFAMYDANGLVGLSRRVAVAVGLGRNG